MESHWNTSICNVRWRRCQGVWTGREGRSALCQPVQSSWAAVASLKTIRASVDCRIGVGQSHVFVAKCLTISQCVLSIKNRKMSGFGSRVDHGSGDAGSCFLLWLCSSPGLCPSLAPGRDPAQMVGVTEQLSLLLAPLSDLPQSCSPQLVWATVLCSAGSGPACRVPLHLPLFLHPDSH